MRSAEEMLDAVLSFARADDRILAVGMEGSRVNVNIPPDAFQDYDITYFVRSIGAFTGDDGWLARFGRPLLIQKPEDMELYPAEEPGYSYLMLFDDYVKLDLTLLEPKDLPAYLAHRPLKAGLAARGHAHTGGSIQDDDLFVFGCLRNIRNHRTRQEHREGGKHQHLTQEDQDVPQPADRHALFPVLQASLPDVCTGNDLLLVVRLDDIDKYQHRHREKTQKPKRSK